MTFTGDRIRALLDPALRHDAPPSSTPLDTVYEASSSVDILKGHYDPLAKHRQLTWQRHGIISRTSRNGTSRGTPRVISKAYHL